MPVISSKSCGGGEGLGHVHQMCPLPSPRLGCFRLCPSSLPGLLGKAWPDLGSERLGGPFLGWTKAERTLKSRASGGPCLLWAAPRAEPPSFLTGSARAGQVARNDRPPSISRAGPWRTLGGLLPGAACHGDYVGRTRGHCPGFSKTSPWEGESEKAQGPLPSCLPGSERGDGMSRADRVSVSWFPGLPWAGRAAARGDEGAHPEAFRGVSVQAPHGLQTPSSGLGGRPPLLEHNGAWMPGLRGMQR